MFGGQRAGDAPGVAVPPAKRVDIRRGQAAFGAWANLSRSGSRVYDVAYREPTHNVRGNAGPAEGRQARRRDDGQSPPAGLPDCRWASR